MVKWRGAGLGDWRQRGSYGEQLSRPTIPGSYICLNQASTWHCPYRSPMGHNSGAASDSNRKVSGPHPFQSSLNIQDRFFTKCGCWDSEQSDYLLVLPWTPLEPDVPWNISLAGAFLWACAINPALVTPFERSAAQPPFWPLRNYAAVSPIFDLSTNTSLLDLFPTHFHSNALNIISILLLFLWYVKSKYP
jgi:hypothetical protein